MLLRNTMYAAVCLAVFLSCALHSTASEAVPGLQSKQYERLLSTPETPDSVDAVRLFKYWHTRLNQTMHPYPPDADVPDHWEDTYFHDLPPAHRDKVVREMSVGVYNLWKKLAGVHYCCRYFAMRLPWSPGQTSPALAACDELRDSNSPWAPVLADAYTGVDLLPSMCAEETLQADAKSLATLAAAWGIVQPDGAVWTLDRAARMYSEAHMKAEMLGFAPTAPDAVTKHYDKMLRRVENSSFQELMIPGGTVEAANGTVIPATIHHALQPALLYTFAYEGLVVLHHRVSKYDFMKTCESLPGWFDQYSDGLTARGEQCRKLLSVALDAIKQGHPGPLIELDEMYYTSVQGRTSHPWLQVLWNPYILPSVAVCCWVLKEEKVEVLRRCIHRVSVHLCRLAASLISWCCSLAAAFIAAPQRSLRALRREVWLCLQRMLR